MRLRVERHQQRRPSHWKTIEDRFDLENLVRETKDVLFLLDCLTLWLSFQLTAGRSSKEILGELEQTLLLIRKLERSFIVVSNEMVAGIFPLTPDRRSLHDLCTSPNHLVAAHATTSN